jgi:hypothetical protein
MSRQVRCAIAVAMAALVAVAGAPPAHADKKDKGDKGKKKGGDDAVAVVFTTSQRDAAHSWYAETYGRDNCPPGLAKKHNGCMPPGQAKKRYQVGHPLPREVHYQPVPAELSARIGKAPAGYVYVTLDGDLLKLAAGTLLVVDAIDGLLH